MDETVETETNGVHSVRIGGMSNGWSYTDDKVRNVVSDYHHYILYCISPATINLITVFLMWVTQPHQHCLCSLTLVLIIRVAHALCIYKLSLSLVYLSLIPGRQSRILLETYSEVK